MPISQSKPPLNMPISCSFVLEQRTRLWRVPKLKLFTLASGKALGDNAALPECPWTDKSRAPTLLGTLIRSRCALMVQNTLKIALAQLNPIVGDVAGNEAKARVARAEAARLGADIVMFTELFLAGYSPEDLVLKPSFQDACRAACERLARETADGGPAMLMGLPWKEQGLLHNAYALLDEGRIAAIRFKVDLPNYGVFDEKRVFAPGPLPGPVSFRGVRLGLPICEDIWSEDVVECLTETGSEILLVPNGSPYWRGKTEERFNIAALRVTESGLPLVYLNQMSGPGEPVFDGAPVAPERHFPLAPPMRGLPGSN